VKVVIELTTLAPCATSGYVGAFAPTARGFRPLDPIFLSEKNEVIFSVSGISLSVRVEAGRLEVIGHNNREFIAKNVDESKIKDNITYKQEDIKVAYENLFSEVLKKYNSSKTKTRDKIFDYFEHIKNSKQEKLFYEAIIQFGDTKTNKVGSGDGEKAKKMLDKYMEEFQKRNPNFYIFNAVMHLDESTPHLHIDFVPFAENQAKGLETRVTLKGALKLQGIQGTNIKHSDRQQWSVKEKITMTEIAHEFGYDVLNKGIHRKHLSVDDFKFAMQEKEKIEKQLQSLINDNGEIISQKEAQLLKNRLRGIINELQISEQKNNSPLIEFSIPDTEKSSLVCEKLNNRRIRYTLTENGIIVPQYAKKIIQETISDFKPEKEFLSLRKSLALDIDRLIYHSDTFENLLENLEKKGYQIRRDRKYISVIPPNGQRPIRLKGLGENYTDEALMKRIAEKDNLYNACQSQLKKATGFERDILSTMSKVMVLFYEKKSYPKKGKQYPDFEPTTFRNDWRISKLLDCAKFVSAEKITVDNIFDKQKSNAEEIENIEARLFKIRKEQKIRKNLIARSDEFFGGGSVSDETKKLYADYGINDLQGIENLKFAFERENANIENLKQELSEKRKVRSALERVSDMSKEISSGSYIDKLVREEKEKEREETEDLE
jgi:hypothetical protein